MFTHKEKYCETRLDSGPAATPQGVDLQLVNGSDAAAADMDPDSSVLCDSQVSSNTNINTNEKTILLEEIQDSGANKSLDSSVSFVEVSNLSQNFTLNVGPTVSNLTAIQNVVPSGNPTLWLPTIITSSSSASGDDRMSEGQGQGEETSSNISQIILSGNGTHTNQILSSTTGQQWQAANNNKYASKVQILTIPKQGSISHSPPVSSIKTMVHTTYINQSDIKTKCSNSVANNSILSSQMHSKNLSNTPVFGGAVGQQQNFQAKAVASEMQVLNMPSSTSSGKHSNNNSLTQHQSHILSKVVPGPKMSSQSFGRAKNNLSQSRSKTSGRSGFQNILQSQGMQSPMSVKIIQQQNVPINNRSGVKSVPSGRSGVLTSKQRASTSNYNQANNHKQGTYSKSIPGSSIGKSMSRNNIPQKLVVQQTPSRLMMSGNVGSYNKGLIQYYQQASVEPSENVRYNSHQGYSNADSNITSNSASNQSLTAQILQTLSQPKLPSSRIVSGHINMSPVRYEAWEESDSYSQHKHIHGDPTTSRSSDDTLGIEEQPNLPDDSLSYHYYSLQLVLLDHTYAVTPQPIPVSSSGNLSSPTLAASNTLSSASHVNNAAPSCSPVKALPSPTKCQSPKLSLNQPNNSLPSENNYSFSNMPSRIVADDREDDAGSVMSSIDGDERRVGERNGSDTETAPEGEGEEEGKTRCVCEFTHDDGYMICCDRCGEWQHVDCMGIDRQNIPDDYMCDQCQPRLIDRKRARAIQLRKKEEITNLYSSASDSSSGMLGLHKKLAGSRGAGLQKKQLLTVTTYSNTTSGVSRTVPLIPPQHQPASNSYSSPYTSTSGVPALVSNKRGPKRTRRVDGARKGPKRKIPEKKIRRKSDVVKYKNKYGTNSSQQVNQWNDSYELAMTNHYSPELRAKIARYASNKMGTNHNTMNSVLTAHFCTTVPHAGSKILIATKDMKENSPIMELRGKYMLSTQHKPQPQPGSRAGSQKPGPFLFFYKFPKDPTQVCIDTRTYGNEARFVRRSCKPNAELQHCIIKGALHVYLVTISTIQSNTEITIRHESSGSYQPCACGNPKHCKQLSSTSSTATDILHRNNGASDTLILRERRGRTRHFSSSMNASTLPSIGSPHRKEAPMPKMDKRRKSEPETVGSDVQLPDNNNSKLLDIKPEPNLESDLEAIKSIIDIKEEFKVENVVIKEERDDKETAQTVLSQEDSDKVDISLVKVKIEKTSDEVDELEAPKTAPPLTTTPVQSPTIENVNKAKDTKTNKSVGVRRTSTHSVRATRQSLSASNANESADEKSDSQTDCKMSAKEKKKMTREERKMEAIVKAIERMEKAEQRKLENKDKQIKRRESDPQQSCSVTSSSESNKDMSQQPDMSEDNLSKVHTKGRPRRRGRSRTASQSKNVTRMNSVDSDNMGTSEDEHHSSLMSPPRKCGLALDNYLDTPPISSADSPFQALVQTDEALKQSFDRIKYGLSSVCLLVEAAVAPLETTFKSPKTKKAIMNEWLNKSPESNMSYDIGSPEYGTSDNNNTNDNIGQKGSYLGAKSTESLIKAASTMIGNLSGGIITADSTPEKNPTSDPSDNECSAKNTPETYSSPPTHSPLSYPTKNLKRLTRDLSRDLAEKNRTPKKMRRVLRNLDSSPLKRSLRSGGGLRELDLETDKNIAEENKVINLESDVSNPIVACLPPPPQHSAKKRWLRQAISEESDSPTAESPPSEMLTPLKKRRLARESLTSEAQTPLLIEESLYPSIIHSPTKDSNTLSTSESKSPDGEKLQEDETNTRSQLLLDAPVVMDDSRDKCTSEDASPAKCVSLLTKCPVQEDSSESNVESSQRDEGMLEEQQNLPLYNQNECVEGKEEILDNNNVDKNTVTEQNKNESTSNVNSNETSCNSSPLLDDMEDIQKKIHSFHTENIQILKIRNKKQPKEKRKKVNLNFDLSVLDDQTVEVKLKCDKDVLTENEPSKDGIAAVPDAITKPADTVSPTSVVVSGSKATENSECNKEEMEETVVSEQSQDISTVQTDKEDVNGVALTNTFSNTLLFSETFRNNSKSSVVESISVRSESSTSVPDMNIIKNVIDMTVNLENSVFKDATLNTSDEYKNVEEILSRVNQMDSSNSVLLSGLMRDASFADDVLPPKVSQVPRTNDPRINPPLTDKPKPIRRKLSITEYRRRHSMVHPSESSSSPPPSTEPSNQSCLSEDEEDISQFEKKLEASLTKLDSIMSTMNMGLLNPQTTVQENHREKLSERLRREFGLSIPEEDLSCSTSSTGVKSDNVSSEQEQREEGISAGLSLTTLASEPLSSQVHLDG